MNIPLDRLYQYIESCAKKIYNDHVVIYRFWPHGSKNIENLLPMHSIKSWIEPMISPAIYCNDQEPLQYDYYKNNLNKYSLPMFKGEFADLLKEHDLEFDLTNLNWYENTFAKNILLHSEKKSIDLEKYQTHNQLIPVYYWSHAVIARDWYRFAEHVDFQKNPKKFFLIYNRSWTGTREYRCKFADLLIDAGLVDHCQTTFNPEDSDSGAHYTNHAFKTPKWQPTHRLEDYFSTTWAPASSSADFEIDDYCSTEVEVVLETLFEDRRWHLTEKILRPIACGQPFILAATPGSLEYLKEYGFQTFQDVWNEDYDTITDPESRLNRIVELMKYLAGLDHDQKRSVMHRAQKIADHNRKLFFSKEFFDKVTNELETNLTLAFDHLKALPANQAFIDRYAKILANPVIKDFLSRERDMKSPNLLMIVQALKLAQSRSQTHRV